ncbi:MAG: ATP-binding protein [Egibacteraceae bacterium]
MLRVCLFGELELEFDGEPLDPPASGRVCSLLASLALHPGSHLRSRIAAVFWPDVREDSARASLRSALWSLRSALGPAAGHLAATREKVGLEGEGLWVDARCFEEHLAAGRLTDAVGVCRDELLGGLDDDWVLEARDRHRDRLCGALGTLADAAEERGDIAGAVGWSRRRVALDPLEEEAWRGLIRRLDAAGERALALEAYQKLRGRLRADLGIAPSAQTRRLADALHSSTLEGSGPERVLERTGAQRARQLAEQGGTSRGAEGAAGATTGPSAVAQDEVLAGPAGGALVPLVGREAELAALDAAWRAVRGGAGGVALICGETGIGKSRLAFELCALGRAEGARIASCVPLDLGGVAPLGVWVELLRDLAADVDPPPTGSRWPEDIGQLVPEIGRRLGTSDSRSEVPPELRRARLFEAAVDCVEWVSRSGPLILVMEDLHLADEQSLELIGYLGRRIAHLPALLLATRREAPARPQLDTLCHRLRSREVVHCELELARLDDADVERIVAAVAPGSDARELVRAAAGNPLLAVEAGRALAAGRSVPESLREGVRPWLAELTAEARRVAELVAVAGRGLGREELAELPVLPEALAQAADSELLACRGGGADYRHALLRTAVYDEVPEARRAWLHEALADTLERREAAGEGVAAAEIAVHLRRCGRRRRAVGALRRAAAEACSMASFEEAGRLLREALELAPRSAELWLELGSVAAWRVQHEEAEAAFARAVQELGFQDPELLCEAWMQRARWYKSSLCAHQLAGESARRALELIEVHSLALPGAERAALATAALAEAVIGEVAEAERILVRLEQRCAGGPMDDVLTCEVGEGRAIALMRRGRFTEACAAAVAAARAAGRARRPDLALSSWLYAACAASCAGEHGRALRSLDRGLAAVQGPGIFLAGQIALLGARVQLLGRLGRHADALAAAEAQRELASQLDLPRLEAEADHNLGLAALAAGDSAEAEVRLAAALAGEPAVSRPRARLLRAEALARLARADEAEAELRKAALEPTGSADLPETLVPRMSRVQALVAAARGDRELADRRLAEAEAGWERCVDGVGAGERSAAVLADLGRVPVSGVVEPQRELELVRTERAELGAEPVPEALQARA